MLAEQGAFTPPNYEQHIGHDPRLWFNEVMRALYGALEPALPRAN